MSTDDSASDTSSDASDQPAETCAACEATLERGSQHSSPNRSTTLYTCPACKLGALATVEQVGPLNERCADRLAHVQSNAMTGLSVYRVAAFVTDEFPSGSYTIERTDDHEFVIELPESATEWTELRLVDRLSVGPLSAERVGGHVLVEDARWSHDDESARADGGVMHSQSESNEDLFVVEEGDEPRTERAKTEDMDVSFAEKPGVYEVHSASDSYYDVDIIAETCSCPDQVERCKHLRRVDLEITAGRVPRPDGKLPGR